MIGSLDPDQTRQNVRSDLGPNSMTQGARIRNSGLDPNCVSHGINYVICRTILYFCLFDLILCLSQQFFHDV